jgi:hypothetical protein
MGNAAFSVHQQESTAWVVAHRELSRLAKVRAAAEAEEGRWLLEALRSAAHLHLGFGSFSEYAEPALATGRDLLRKSCGWRRRWKSCRYWRVH